MNEEKIQEEVKKLKKIARKTKNARMRVRYDAVRLWLQGRSRTDISEILSINYQTVRNYINAYSERSIEGLTIGKSTGRKTKLTTDQEKLFYGCIVNNMPKDVGFEPFVNWTAPLAKQWVEKEFGIVFSERGMRDVFYRLGLSYTRPTYTLKKANPVEQEKFKQEFDAVKKN